jgi:methylated-DNA-[protein]-cysteine S-methyltransferase
MAMTFCLIETKLGTFGLGWTADGIARTALPDENVERTEKRMRQGGATPGEPPEDVAAVAERIVGYAEGARDDFRDVSLDLSGIPTFRRSAYVAARRVGYGLTTTYGEIANKIGDLSQARAVGSAMAENPIPLIIPCHRVLAVAGTGGFSAPGGVDTKLRLLALENATTPKGQWSFNF